VDKIFKAVDKVLDMSEKVAGKTDAMGPMGGRRWPRSVGLAATLLIVLFFGARLLLELPNLATSLRVGIALLPLPAFLWLLWAFINDVREADELERRIQLEALAIAFPLTLVLVMTLGLLQIAIPLPPEDWSYRHIWPLIYVFYLGGLTLARRRYL
jgi:hypothetical protein